jgi:hypothetical protein
VFRLVITARSPSAGALSPVDELALEELVRFCKPYVLGAKRSAEFSALQMATSLHPFSTLIFLREAHETAIEALTRHPLAAFGRGREHRLVSREPTPSSTSRG